MRGTLVADGLFDDEAQAMLNTWNRAYFEKHGLRVFFSVPRAWTDHRMPLALSVPADITRVMVGRIELDQSPSSGRCSSDWPVRRFRTAVAAAIRTRRMPAASGKGRATLAIWA